MSSVEFVVRFAVWNNMSHDRDVSFSLFPTQHDTCSIRLHCSRPRRQGFDFGRNPRRRISDMDLCQPQLYRYAGASKGQYLLEDHRVYLWLSGDIADFACRHCRQRTGLWNRYAAKEIGKPERQSHARPGTHVAIGLVLQERVTYS